MSHDTKELIRALVKPLGPWRDSSVPASGVCHAPANVGTYFIERNHDGYFWVNHDDRGVAHCKDLPAAQAAAEADYRARIAAALELDKVAALVEAATRYDAANDCYDEDNEDAMKEWRAARVALKSALAALGDRGVG